MNIAETFVLASNNKHKLIEMRRILSDFGIKVISQSEAGFIGEAEETGATFEENARLKADAVTCALSIPAIADDSGLEVDALSGEPGVYSARYGGSSCSTDEDRYQLLLKNLGATENRRARFVSCISCTFPDGTSLTARGECEGEILFEAKGDGGFGYDPVFLYPETGKSFGEMSAEEKDQVSHRALALTIFKEKLRELYADR